MDSFADTIKQLGVARLGIMGAIIVGMLLFFTFVSFRVSSPDMALLYSDLSNTDSSAMAAKLEEIQVPYRVSPDGTRLEVSQDDVGRARMLLAQEGLPNGGSLGYELFDEQSGFGTTNFVQNVNQVRALEGELSRTISSLENVRSARVHLVLPQRELFSRESRESSASVFLGLRPGASVEREQIAAIQSIVASAVPELNIANVSIIDNSGKLLARGGENSEDLMSLKAEERRLAYEGRLTQKIEDQVSRIVGFGNVRATVTAEMNFDRISTNEELFDPEGQVVRSTQVSEESNTERESAANDTVSVENQLPGVGGDLLLDEGPSLESNRIEEVTNFEISRTVRSTVREVGEIQRMSVAVLVDGKYIDGPEEGQQTYEPRTEQEIQQITALVRSASGFDESRGDTIEVINMQFADVVVDAPYTDDRFLFGFEKSDLIDIAEILTISIMIILVVLLILQPMVGRLLEAERPSREDEEIERDLLAATAPNPALAAPEPAGENEVPEEDSLINIQGVEGKVKASSIKKVEEIVENYPNEAVSVIRSWMTQEG